MRRRIKIGTRTDRRQHQCERSEAGRQHSQK
jgi:hypothetical protein